MAAKTGLSLRVALLTSFVLILSILSSRLNADTGTCGGQFTSLPFTDVAASPFFCQIAEAYFSGLTNGTSNSTYSPADPVLREQMAAFVTRTLDQSLTREGRRASLDQWWATNGTAVPGTTVGVRPTSVKSDGSDLWVANLFSGTVSRVRASDARLLETWTGATNPEGVLVAFGRIYICGGPTSPAIGRLYVIDPTQAAGAMTVVTSSLGTLPTGITTDGRFIWTANGGLPGGGSVSRFDPGSGVVTTFTAGFANPGSVLFDGTNIWVVDFDAGTLLRLNSDGTIAQTVLVGSGPAAPIFDGTNIWLPNQDSNSVSVIRASTGLVIATLTGNGLAQPQAAAFDGQRILVTNFSGGVSLWMAADLTPIGSFPTQAGAQPAGACSDGLNFWFNLQTANKLVRF